MYFGHEMYLIQGAVVSLFPKNVPTNVQLEIYLMRWDLVNLPHWKKVCKHTCYK